jgi:hypothetical protein
VKVLVPDHEFVLRELSLRNKAWRLILLVSSTYIVHAVCSLRGKVGLSWGGRGDIAEGITSAAGTVSVEPFLHCSFEVQFPAS